MLSHVSGADVIIKNTNDKLQTGIQAENGDIESIVGTTPPETPVTPVQQFETPPPPPRYHPAIVDTFPEGKELYNHIINNPDRYPINDRGKVIANNGQVVKSSDIGEIVYHFFHADSPGEVTPIGYSKYKTKLAADPVARELYSQFKQKTPRRGTAAPQREDVFTPSRWNMNQR